MADRLDRALVPATGMIGRRDLLASTAAAMALMLAAPKVGARGILTAPAFGIRALMLKAYIYGYAPVAAWATMGIQTAVPDANTIPGAAPINQFAYIKTLANPSETTVIRPNADTIYTLAWLDLSEQPMVISLPAVTDRYYVVPLLDAYTNEFFSLGSRTTGSGAGNYLVAGPGWSGTPPPGITLVIPAPTPTVWVIGRTLVRGPDDLENAVAVTSQYQLIPLDQYPGPYTPPTNVPVTPPDPDFVPPEGEPATAAIGFGLPEFFQIMQEVIAANPPPSDQHALVESFRAAYANADRLTADLVQAALKVMTSALGSGAEAVNGWGYLLDLGNYGENYALRGGVALSGLGAITAADAVYANCSTDETGAPLDGSKAKYQIRFAAGQTPPVQGFWSITVYNEKGLLVANPINRYAVGSETGLVADADGSVTIQLWNTQPPAPIPEANWLPVPDGRFSLTLRMYWPGGAVLNNSYVIPPVEVVAA